MTAPSALPFYFIIGLAALPAPLGVFAALYYNVITFRLVRKIQAVFRLQGTTWPFWLERDRLIAFVLKPDELLSGDPPLAQDEKFALIRHRRTLKHYLIRTFAFMFCSFGLAMALLLVTALVRR